MIATLLVDADKVEIVMNRFEKNARIRRKTTDVAKTKVKICAFEQFFGWIIGLRASFVSTDQRI